MTDTAKMAEFRPKLIQSNKTKFGSGPTQQNFDQMTQTNFDYIDSDKF